MTSISLSSEYVIANCGPSDSGGCGLSFAMNRRFYDEMHRTGATWYCPKGHPRVYGGATTEQKLEAAEARGRHLEDQLRAAEADAEQVRVRLLRDRRRFANGVCPCCNRSFENVRRHVTSQHPEYNPEGLQRPSFKCSCGKSFETLRGLRTHQGHMREDSGRYDWRSPKTSRYSRHLTEVGAS